MVRVALTVEQNWNSVPGGTVRSTNRLIEAIAETGLVDQIGVAGLHRRDPTLPVPDRLELRRIPVPGRALVHAWDRLDRPAIDRWVPDADLLHGPAYLLPPSVKPAVVTIHDLAFVRRPEWFTAHGARFLTRLLDKVLARRPAVIVPSEATASDCLAVGIPESDLHVVPWGVEGMPVDDLQIESVRRRFRLPESFVLYVGTLEPRKNIGVLVEAMKTIADRRLVLAGPKGWGPIEPFDGLHLGEVDDADVPPLMAAADVLVYPSRFEGFGLPVLEAMAQGTPVIVTEGTAPAHVAGPGGLAVDTLGSGPLAEAIAAVLADDGLRSKLGEQGRARATEFDWRTSAELTIAVYRSVLG